MLSRPRLLWLAMAALFAGGCGLLLGVDQFKTSADGGVSGNCDPSKGCVDKSCAPSELALLNRCTDPGVDCVPFDDDARVKGPRSPEGGPAPYPAIDAGIQDAEPIEEAGTSTPCSKIPGATGPVLVVQGTAKSYVAALARALFTDKDPITIVWRGMSSCFAWAQLLDGEPIVTQPGAGYGTYWTPNDADPVNGNRCAFLATDAGPVFADVTVADLFAQSCRTLANGLPSNIGDFFGPVQTMTFIAPKASSETAISATAAYFVYGFGAQSGTAPWTDPSFLYRLADESGTQRLISAGIGVAAPDWKGTNLDHSGALLAKVKTPTPGMESKTIGPMAYTNIQETDRPSVEILAYKHYGQMQCAYFPDSTQTAKDKRNVRDGHYALWGPIHFATRVSGNGLPVSANAQRVINMWTGVTPPPGGLDLMQIAAINNLVPKCAMKVQRKREMGPLEPFQADTPCGCYFEKVAGAIPKCPTCQKEGDCPASSPRCGVGGFCEAP